MKRILLVALLALAASAGTARADGDVWVVVPTPVLPSASTPNGGDVALRADLGAEPAVPQQLSDEQLRAIWIAAGAAYGVPWTVLAAINKVETDFGRNLNTSSAGAIGWMQFMPGTWREYGTDGDGDGVADPWNAEDAIYSAARYLAASGAATDLRQAIFAYNHADWYVEEVLNFAAVYEAGGGALSMALSVSAQVVQADVDAAEQRVEEAEQDLADARARMRALAAEKRTIMAETVRGQLVSDRLEGERRAAQAGAELGAERAEVRSLHVELEAAREALVAARSGTFSSSFGAGGGYVTSAPSFAGGWVFPVGGGPQLVSVGHDHHDYPAADIAAPAGSPVYALADAVVADAWPEPTGTCGIGATVTTSDARSWTYCHLAYLDAAVATGATLPAGTFMGLVGTTGHSTGPHLHLQLQPAAGYPQAEKWFESFAGTAYRWQEATSGVFSVSGEPGLNSGAGSAEE